MQSLAMERLNLVDAFYFEFLNLAIPLDVGCCALIISPVLYDSHENKRLMAFAIL